MPPTFFRSQTCNPVTVYDRKIKFSQTSQFAGLVRGVFCAEDETDEFYLRMLAADPGSGIEEITQQMWEHEMKRQYRPPPAPSEPLINLTGQVKSDPPKAGAKLLPINIASIPRSEPTTLIELGRYGDVINILPPAWALARANPSGKTRVVVGSQYAGVLDGCSYIEPVVFDGDFSMDYLRACEWAKNKFGGHQLATQVYFGGSVHSKQTNSFVTDSWLKAGFSPMWWNELPTIFDNRNHVRESLLIREHQTKKRNVLVCFDGTSSPFGDRNSILRILQDTDFNVVDIGKIKADRIYDLLGLMDAAAGLITIDTSILHLAAAARCPYIALITDFPTAWHGSIPRGNCVLGVRYGEVSARLSEIAAAIGMFDHPTLHHLWTGPMRLGPDENRRHSIAQATWKSMLWVEHKVGDYSLDRVFQCGQRMLPYIRDMIDRVVNGIRDEDWVVLTNADICVTPSLDTEIRKVLNVHECCWSNRRDFKLVQSPIPVDQVKNGHDYSGTDLFAFRAGWWRRRREMMPDVVFGAEGWDLCMRVLMQEDGGIQIRDLIYHERHDSGWEKHENRFTWKSQLHNRTLARQFCLKRGHDPKPHGL